MIKKNNYLPEILNDSEIEDLLDKPNLRTPTGFRNYLLIKLILNTGITLSETTSLTWNNINLFMDELKINNDNAIKERTLLLNYEMIKLFQSWEIRQKVEIGKCEYVFTTLDGKKIQNQYVRKMIKRYSNKAYIIKKVSPYTLRHTCGANLYKDTKDLKIVKNALGLNDLNYTKKYAIIADENYEYI